MAEYDTEDRVKKERSPSFPFISLRKALDKAEQMLAFHKRSPARVSVISSTWGYSPSSSGLVQTVAALKAYGLLDDVGRGEDRRVQLSELALRILSDTREGAREAGIKDAAVRPKILREYMETWRPDRPSDGHCVSELTLDRGFTNDAAKLFLRIFDDNLSFADLKNDDNVPLVSKDEASSSSRETAPVSRNEGRMRELLEATSVSSGEIVKVRSLPQTATTFPVTEGLVTLSLPLKVSKKSIETIKAWLNFSLDLWPTEPDPSLDFSQSPDSA